ncbi:MAG: hypothetical protein CL831_10430 [Crocinitomicaceae bacterium]|nr:hypothetical protein [Crocinitomicaceae bacterium]|tara:strand:- start:40 stop:1080 length:1041 start_codon:yes stop_codon:yes gene_type:complete
MKHFYIFTTILLLCFFKLNAQTTDVITNIVQPTSVFVDGNDIYFGSYFGSLYKVDMTSPQNQSTIISTSGVYRTFLYGNDLYVSERIEGKISKIDITQSSPSPVDVITGLNTPTGIFIQDDILYFGEDVTSISKIDLNDTNPVKTIISNTFNDPTGINLIGNDLYVAEFDANKISKIDITQSSPSPVDVITGLSSPTEILVVGNDLLVSEFSGNRIIQIDLTNSTPVISDLVTNINNPTGLFLNGNDLYISVYGDNKIVKFSSTTLSTEEYSSGGQKFKVFPNPSTEYIQVSNLTTNKNYKIYSILGAEIKSGYISNNDMIDIKNLTNGAYFLKLENVNLIKFLKK